MKKIAKSISGGSLLISGTLILNLVMAGMDWTRINTYGLFHELSLRGIAPIMFIISIAFFIIGIILLIMACVSDEKVSDESEEE
jgi:uncharacterized membrane protein